MQGNAVIILFADIYIFVFFSAIMGAFLHFYFLLAVFAIMDAIIGFRKF